LSCAFMQWPNGSNWWRSWSRGCRRGRGWTTSSLVTSFEALTTHESSLDSREATLKAGQKDLEDARPTVVVYELATDVRETDLDTRVVELVKRLAGASRCSEQTGGAPIISSG
jgi:hypothetical protein